jgi:anti-sigma regulatory factor (Ser/Thr protein kinase)
MISEVFDRSRITPLRHTVAALAGKAGLTGERLEDFVVAVNELLTNVVRHGGGTGHLALWSSDGTVICEVRDHGGGLDSVTPRRPAPDQPGGWGLWLVRELTDTCAIKTGPGGTAVRISCRTGP